jgi:hypothetical protein
MIIASLVIILCSLEMAWFLSTVVLAYLLGSSVDQVVVKWGAGGLTKGRRGRSGTGRRKRIGLSKTSNVVKGKTCVQGVRILVK